MTIDKLVQSSLDLQDGAVGFCLVLLFLSVFFFRNDQASAALVKSTTILNMEKVNPGTERHSLIDVRKDASGRGADGRAKSRGL